MQSALTFLVLAFQDCPRQYAAKQLYYKPTYAGYVSADCQSAADIWQDEKFRTAADLSAAASHRVDV